MSATAAVTGRWNCVIAANAIKAQNIPTSAAAKFSTPVVRTSRIKVSATRP